MKAIYAMSLLLAWTSPSHALSVLCGKLESGSPFYPSKAKMLCLRSSNAYTPTIDSMVEIAFADFSGNQTVYKLSGFSPDSSMMGPSTGYVLASNYLSFTGTVAGRIYLQFKSLVQTLSLRDATATGSTPFGEVFNVPKFYVIEAP